MSRSPAKLGNATAMKLLKEKWLSIVQSVGEKGEKGIGGFSTVTVFSCRISLPPDQEGAATGFSPVSEDHLDFIFFFAIYKVRRWLEEIGAVFRRLHIVCEKRGVKDGVNLPLGGDVEVKGRSGYDLLDFKWAGSFHLEFLGSVHVKIGGL